MGPNFGVNFDHFGGHFWTQKEVRFGRENEANFGAKMEVIFITFWSSFLGLNFISFRAQI